MTDRTPTTLYRLFADDGTLLYVGIAGNPGRRFEQHAGTKPWWALVGRTTLEHFPTRPQAAEAELRAIRQEYPKHNIIANGARTGTDQTARRVGAGDTWKWHSLRTGFEFNQPLYLMWEVDGSTMTDDYLPSEITAHQLWERWRTKLDERGFWHEMGRPWVTVSWFVLPCFEAAPFQRLNPLEDFLSFYSWPIHAITGERLNWNRLPVPDQRWTPDQGDKGGFIQEVTGWKPSPLQPAVDVEVLAASAGLVPARMYTRAR